MFQRGSSLYQFLELASENSCSRYINRESQQLNELLQGLNINNLWVCVYIYNYIIRYTCKHYVYIIVNLWIGNFRGLFFFFLDKESTGIGKIFYSSFREPALRASTMTPGDAPHAGWRGLAKNNNNRRFLMQKKLCI